MRPDPGPGLAALPLPQGDAVALWRTGAVFRRVGEDVASRSNVASSAGLDSAHSGWTGAAAEEARTEERIVSNRGRFLSDRLTRAAAILESYADEVDAAQRAVATLQSSWDVACLADPHSPVPLPELARLTGLHAVVVADLELASNVAAYRFRSLTGEVTEPDLARHRPATFGWADPAPSDTAVRATTLAGLDVVRGAQARVDADHLVDEVKAELDAVAAGDLWAVDRVLALLGPRVRDPVVTSALWARVTPADAASVLDALAAPSSPPVASAWRSERNAALLTALGAALATAANPAYAGGLDPATTARLDAWRVPWLQRLATSAASAARRADGGLIGGAWAQGQLLTGAHQAGLTPGAGYASTVAVAVVAADRAARSGPSGGLGTAVLADTTATGRQAVIGAAPADPVVAVARALAADADAARLWLLTPLAAPVPGSARTLVVDHLVGGRYLTMDSPAAATSLAETGRLVVAVGSDPTSRESMTVASAFLGAVAHTSLTKEYPEAFRRVLAPTLGEVGTVLAAHPNAIPAVLDDSTGPGVDVTTTSDADRLTRPGRDRHTWDIVLADRAAAEALVGELALDGSDDTDARHPTTAPALTAVVDQLGQQLEDDLLAAVAADHAGDAHALEAAAQRLGATAGFVLTSAGKALAGRDADVDTRNRALGDAANAAIGHVAVPGLVGKVATPLVRYAAGRVVAATLPTGSEAAQREATDRAVTGAREQAYTRVRTLVSQAQPWTEALSPQHWSVTNGAARGAVCFWDERGVPLPEDRMTTAQRRSFTDWRRDERLSIYDVAPVTVREGIEAGVTDSLATRSPRS